jgi:hypothetical protein
MPTPVSTTTVYVRDMDGSSVFVRSRWEATVRLLVHDTDEAPVTGATVSGSWSGGATGSNSCVVDASAQCEIAKTKLKDSIANVTFTIDDIVSSTVTYEPAGNHDPDGDSDGTTITIAQP